MTPEKLKELQAFCDAATPGPWKYLPPGNSIASAVIGRVQGRKEYILPDGSETRDADMEFIAAAREWLPKLLDEVERLLGEAEPLTIEIHPKDMMNPFAIAAKRASDKTREACAKLADNYAKECDKHPCEGNAGAAVGARAVAQAIRAQGGS